MPPFCDGNRFVLQTSLHVKRSRRLHVVLFALDGGGPVFTHRCQRTQVELVGVRYICQGYMGSGEPPSADGPRSQRASLFLHDESHLVRSIGNHLSIGEEPSIKPQGLHLSSGKLWCAGW